MADDSGVMDADAVIEQSAPQAAPRVRRAWLSGGDYRLTRLVLQRSLAVVYLIAFIVAANQFVPLCGERGLLPVPLFVGQLPFSAAPSLFFWFPRDGAFTAAAWIGVA